ncbi:uncharacterized protein HKW66_Vig0151260 [Vigna angularis]|uniref:Uncharacterized protein n=1 Tax=Phaseolus angularis TaxID=3914 RepID=A0A8T0JWX3_PHAAN|nr:uncharacterized protein LOC108344535 [Vigna angularis]KAG2384111.1 uncharacterized protein HKW66_Vig0151260 [Vigna angularis]
MAYSNYESSKKGSGKKLKVHFDLPEDDDYPNHKRSGSLGSARSSSSDSDDGMDNADSKYCGMYGSPVWSFQGGSVTQSPPLQLMNSPGYDPNRIPSSIFNKPASPMEWSVASNESLFSIHIGNNSFSKDHAFALSNRSGDFPRTTDIAALPSVEEVNSKDKNVDMERHSLSSDSPSETSDSVTKQDHEKKTSENAGSVVDTNKTETSEVSTHETVLDKTPDDHSKEVKMPNGEPKKVFRSMGSDLSTRSFQFPILTAEGGRNSSSTVDSSEKQEKGENQEQQPENDLQKNPSSKSEKAPKQSGKTWCFCFTCSPCF